ncbi:MAG: hypothetical protein ACI959_001833 [Limisphaerales bacterium]|jgi:hypothetical protein
MENEISTSLPPFTPDKSDRFHTQPVQTKQDAKDFIRINVELNKQDSNYIRPLDKDIDFVFDKSKNKFFTHGDCVRWLLKDKSGKVVGRAAAFYNERTLDKTPKTGGMGFFECIDDQEAANVLFDQCRLWNQSQGLAAMDGPINFGERNNWWGLLVDGFTEPVYTMNYNPKYYQTLFENYGFKDYFKQYSYYMVVNDPRPEGYIKIWDKFKGKPDYSFKKVDKNNLEKGAEDFRKVYNGAWGGHEGFRDMTDDQAMKMMTKMKPVIIDYLMWFGYYKEEPIAFYINLPELNQLFKHVNGKLDLIGKLKFFYHSRIAKTNRKFFGIVFGVIPRFQRTGMEGAIAMAAHHGIAPTGRWDDFELTWIGDFNPKMMAVADRLGAKIIKTHITYRLLFDPKAEFVRNKIIE